MSVLTTQSACAQLGINLTFTRGGVAKAAYDYRNAVGGVIYSLLNAHVSTDSQLPHTTYFTTAPGRWSTLSGRLTRQTAEGLVEQLKKQNHIALHGSYRLTVEYARRAMQHKNHPKISYIPHGSLDPWVFKKNRWLKIAWLKFYSSLLFDTSANVIAATKSELHKIQRIAGSSKNQLVIPLPIEIPSQPTEQQRHVARRQLALPDEARVLLYLGRLHPMKRPAETLRFVCNHPSQNIYLIMAGPQDGVTHATLNNIVKQAKAEHRVKVVGHVEGETKRKILMASDGFISLSHRENFNYAAAESLAYGLPLILSPGNDLSDELRPANCGWMLPDVSKTSVHQALTSFAEMKMHEQRNMGNRGRAWADGELNTDRFTDNVRLALSQ